jgi:excisionase family DNA binding protein
MHYTVEEFAKLFKYDPQTIRRLIREKRIHAFRLGKGKKSPYRIMQEEVGRLREIGFEEQMKDT